MFGLIGYFGLLKDVNIPFFLSSTVSHPMMTLKNSKHAMCKSVCYRSKLVSSASPQYSRKTRICNARLAPLHDEVNTQKIRVNSTHKVTKIPQYMTSLPYCNTIVILLNPLIYWNVSVIPLRFHNVKLLRDIPTYQQTIRNLLVEDN